MKILTLAVFSFALAFAGEKYGVYDSHGSRVSTFEAERHELPEKARQIKSGYPNKAVYVSSLQKGKGSKPTSRYRFKTGSYIEAARKETFAICPPDKKTEGIWISEHSVDLSKENCLSVQTPDLAGTIDVLFMESNGKTDTIQVLVDQSYIQMGDYLHKIWVLDSMPKKIPNRPVDNSVYGHYESRVYSQPLIVDKTKFTLGDAWHYHPIIGIRLDLNNRIIPFLDRMDSLQYPKNEKFEGSKLPYMGSKWWDFANARSAKEGLDSAYYWIDRRSYGSKEYHKKLIVLGDTNKFDAGFIFLAVDTSASGYRLPFQEEWLFLMRAGASTKYYWGDEEYLPKVKISEHQAKHPEYWHKKKEDSLKISRYVWLNPIGLKPVAKLLPNGFGLYDMIGIAREEMINRLFYTYDRYYGDPPKFFNHYDLITSNSMSHNGGEMPESAEFIRHIGTLVQYMGMQEASRDCIMGSGETEWKCVEHERKPVLKNSLERYESFRLIRKTPKLHKLEKF
ncbi:MAG: formylglycine-generating enzyme family protein [Fibromonadaceae bacterium]|nr:formylglycine-generating enzyme family protein [Fibromonadaceae bacterium]